MNRFENGMDSFQKAIGALDKLPKKKDVLDSRDTEYVMKEVVMCFHHAIEILFKDVLYDKCPILNARDIQSEIDRCYRDRMGRSTENSEDNHTSAFLETVKRMIVICGLPVDSYIYDKFERLNWVRNAVMHNEVDLLYEHGEKLVLELFPYVVWIMEQNLCASKREQFEQYIIMIKSSHAKWRLETLLSLFRLDAKGIAGNRQNKLLLSILDVPAPNLDSVYKSDIREWLENQFCWTMVQMNETDWESYRQTIIKTPNAGQALKNYTKRFLRRTFEYFSVCDGILSALTAENRLYVMMTLQKIRPVIALEAWLHHKKRFQDARKAIRFEDWHMTLEEVHEKVEEWKQKQRFCLISEDGRKIFNKLDGNKILARSIWESDDFINYASAVIRDEDDVFDEINGDLGEISTIDRVNVDVVKDVIAIKCDNIECNEYTVYLQVRLHTESYFDHEFFPNGGVDVCISMQGVMQEELLDMGVPFEKRNVSWIGRMPHYDMSRGLSH